MSIDAIGLAFMFSKTNSGQTVPVVLKTKEVGLKTNEVGPRF